MCVCVIVSKVFVSILQIFPDLEQLMTTSAKKYSEQEHYKQKGKSVTKTH